MWEHIFDSILWPKYDFSLRLPVMPESHRADFLSDTQELHNSGARGCRGEFCECKTQRCHYGIET